ncbi:MAG TPA: succinate dehydrogenase/fumarate reductase iron-sulfur subunit, partial [Micromonosporaceae bacterium]|nr:succinate dehydrogenase/fumarate reductase iron-sulfur subunit [Micromonosporaceae bacterium]
YCNITKCCTEVCPEHIKITDNAIVPMKERVVDRRYDPIVVIGRKILRRDQMPPLVQEHPSVHSGHVTVAEDKAPVNFSRELLPPMPTAVDDKGHVNLNEMLSDRSAAASPFGDEITFPVDPKSLNYYHPDKH